MDLKKTEVRTPHPGVTSPKKKMSKWLKGILITVGSLVGLFILLVCLSECDTTEEVTISPASVAIVGPAGDIFEVVDKPVTTFVHDWNVKMSVNLKRVGEGNVSDYELGVELIGENDDVLSVEYNSWGNQNLETLDGLREGETGSVKFEFMTDSKLKAKKIKKFRVMSKVKKEPEPIKDKPVDALIDELVDYVGQASELQKSAASVNDEELTSVIYVSLANLEKPILKVKDKLTKAEANGEVTDAQKKRIKALLDKLATIEASVQKDKNTHSSTIDEGISTVDREDISDDKEIEDSEKVVSKVSSTSSDNDWDSLLDEYEKCVNELVPLVKKVKEGDTSVLDEYESAKDNALKLKAKLSKAEGSMTKKQVARLTLLSVKLGRAIF